MIERESIPLFKAYNDEEMECAVLDVMRSGQIASGPIVERFEHEFGEYVGRQHLVATNDMTSAIVLALRLAGIKSGDVVATIAFACLSTNSAISILGAIPLWIDIDPITMSMCASDLKIKMSRDVKAVILYYVAGYPADVERINTICNEYEVPLVEDCNNALGARVNDKNIGQYGEYAVFSFYPNRQVNAFDGGALACPNYSKLQEAKKLRRFGVDYTSFRDKRGEINPESDVPTIGISASFSQLHAAGAISQLNSLQTRQKLTIENAEKLTEALAGISGLRVIEQISGCIPSYWCLLLDIKKRDKVLEGLKARNISCSTLHHRNDLYTGFNGARSSLPGTEYVAEHILAIPCGWWLNDEHIKRIVHALKHGY